MDRILAGCHRPPEVVTVGSANLPEVVAEIEEFSLPEDSPGAPSGFHRPLIFTVQHLSDDPEDWPDVAHEIDRCGEASESTLRALLGHFKPVHPYHVRADDQRKNYVCWPTFDFKTMRGCPHGCHYCGEGKNGKYVVLGVNLEEFVDEVVPRVVADHPDQRCFRLIGWGSEQTAFEPEYGAFELFNEKLTSLDRHLYFHSSGDSVEWVADLPHPGRIIGVFSVTCD